MALVTCDAKSEKLYHQPKELWNADQKLLVEVAKSMLPLAVVVHEYQVPYRNFPTLLLRLDLEPKWPRTRMYFYVVERLTVHELRFRWFNHAYKRFDNKPGMRFHEHASFRRIECLRM